MNAEVKRHIDAARQVLVGVVPNPTSQIDQITNALIYKFMDDMDQAAIKVGGEPSFFVGELEKYAWTKIMDSRLGNQERMNLYQEALIKFSESKQLPQLFKDIFRSAFLPYRSPEVLGLFLKEINFFDYSHSEELGNAYEYLLSVMSSQGDAGQFRTPRHIIDFIVEVVNPSKDDKVLDPACGTAGFLISAYKHILRQHSGEGKKPLTPDERKNLMNNFEGYDIDPGMARIAQVNMYLHQFKNPQIFQYDSLSSDERWNDKFDVILANPPFMSPKGGIIPHKKFSIQSTRSEVLFVDYIMNHLRPRGRAGIIVPEGIIFQSGTAYKQLRKSLIEDGLYAVVSLPSGVFSPYSGVKTSILLFDNEVAKLTKNILFVKIENDGFSLGAQRIPIDGSNLPLAAEGIKKYREFLLTGNTQNDLFLTRIKEDEKVGEILRITHDKFSIVAKELISKDGDYNLSSDRYKIDDIIANQKWPMVKVGDLVEISNGYAFKSENYTSEGVRIIRITNVQKGEIIDDNPKYYPMNHEENISKFLLQENDLLMSLTGNVGRVGLLPGDLLPAALNQRVACIRIRDKDVILLQYLFLVLNSENFENSAINSASGVAQKNLSTEWLKNYEIPLPPLEIQQQIVDELDGYQKIISGAKQVVESWKPKIEIDPQWKKVKLSELTERITKGTTPTTNGFHFQSFGVNFIKIESINESGDYIEGKFAHISEECNESLKRSKLKSGDVLFSIAGVLGRVAIVKDSILPANTNQALAIISPKKDLSSEYLEQVLRSDMIQGQIYGLKVGVAQSNLSLTQVSNFEIPIPPLESQKRIVEKIEEEKELVSGNKKLIEIYEKKIKSKIAEVWGEEKDGSSL